MKIVLANDHAGFALKAAVIRILHEAGHEVLDVGTQDDAPVDFPLVTQRLTRVLLGGEADRGVLVCGTGVGACIAANKVPGIRAAVIHDVYSAAQSVEHDDVNVACLGAWIVGPKVAGTALEAFTKARFSTDPDFRRRVAQLADMERTHNPLAQVATKAE
ncbi:RpiB/LacA/LacB family sugar-phosphate isomerase [Paenarthrobacter sp. NyZ202]|uniref:RpiB/LacA/LacB family sugar-phosphate isomerase n=1 Tax=Paenarthrobacter sp. NyZ202 TaxID=3402689 RepID=UPI003CFAD435